MKRTYASNEDFLSDMRLLIETWCDRRCLRSLAILLPAFTSFNGMTDGWGELLAALKGLALSNDALTNDERDRIADLKQAAEIVLYRP